ncbi:MAG: hypothetical protein J5496_02910 [Lachnospiraceae bacterium]|nr:hypothetical protein [Lachnospiraceae bacterium]
MKYVNQLDYPDLPYVTRTDMDEINREKGKTTTVASSGCGLCSAVMVADRLRPDRRFELADALQLSYDVKANFEIGTDGERFFPAFAAKLELRCESAKDPDALRQCLKDGGAVIVLVSGSRDGYSGIFSNNEHWIAAVSEEPDGRILVLDSAFRADKYTTKERREKVEVKDFGLCLCEIKTLEEESAPYEKPFYLFWRE